MQQRLPKFQRVPTAVGNRQITDRSLAVIAAIARYRFLPTSLLLRLVEGNPAVTARHLQALFHRGLIARFALPRHGYPSEFTYVIENPDALRLLVADTGIAREELDFESVQRNRENGYADINDPSKADATAGRLLFLRHELMLSRFHAMIELACRASDGSVELVNWRQGSQLWQTIDVPRMKFDRSHKRWYEGDDVERLPHRPDAFFTLRFPQEPEGQNRANFFYEADCNTMGRKQMIAKFRSYFQAIVKQHTHQTLFGIQRVRAVLLETLNIKRTEQLRDAARHPTVSGARPSPLFWFSASEIFTKEEAVGNKTLPRFLLLPKFILNRVWVSPVDDTLHSLLD